MLRIFRHVSPTLVALGLISGVWLPFTPESCAQDGHPKLDNGVISRRGVAFVREVDARYRFLNSHDLLKADNDVKSITLKYFAVGMRFEDAEDILRAAGCAVSERHHEPPPLTTLEDQMWTMRVSGICKVGESIWDNGTRLSVVLYPKTPTDYSVVGDIAASIVVQSF